MRELKATEAEMASLKDMRVRIASTKATQKITKAMQMVAASKLRRAQAAAEAARPLRRAHGEGARQHRRRRSPISIPRRRCWPAPATTKSICWWSAPAERGLCGRSTRRSCAWRASTINALIGAGQDGQDFLRRPQGLRAAAPPIFDKQIIEVVELRGVRTLGFEHADRGRRKDSSSCTRRASSMSRRCSSRASSR